MYCVSLDPGCTTGICVVRNENDPWCLEVLQIGPDEHHLALLKLLTLWRPQVIVTESFENRGQDAAILTSKEYIGIVKLYLQSSKCKLVLQSSSIGKQFWDNAKLVHYGFYLPRMTHARDACRHYLYYRTFTAKDQTLLRNRNGSVLHYSA